MAETKYAIRKLERKADGTMTIVYIDAATGEKLTSLEGYIVYSEGEAERASITNGNTTGSVTDATTTDKTDTEKDSTTAQKIKRGITSSDDSSGGSSGGGSGLSIFDRSPTNNYGYLNTPNWLGWAGFIPGPIGSLAKWTDRAADVSNSAAANSAREGLGLEPNGLGRTITNAIGLTSAADIANVTINDNPYAVGFEALNSKGQTTLTPAEAQRRSAPYGGVVEMTKPEVQDWQNDFKEEFPDATKTGLGGLVGSVASAIKNLFSPATRNASSEGSGSPYAKASDIPDSQVPIPASKPSLGDSGSSSDFGAGNEDVGLF